MKPTRTPSGKATNIDFKKSLPETFARIAAHDRRGAALQTGLNFRARGFFQIEPCRILAVLVRCRKPHQPVACPFSQSP